MDIIAVLEGSDLATFYRAVGVADTPSDVYRLRIAVDGDYVKVKANEWTWSPPIKRGSEDS